MDLLAYALGGLLICALVRWWRPEVARRAAAGYLAAAGAFFILPLATPALQVGSDIPYVWRPWAETLPATTVHQPANPLLGDIPLQLVPYRTLVRERLLRGKAPLWVHEVGTGSPLLGNAYAAPFSPLHLLALPLPAIRSMTVVVVWQTLLALLLTHALLLALGARPAGAALAAVSYAFSAFQVVWAYHPHAMSAAWLPGVLLGLILLRRGERGGFAGLVTCGLGMALSGHPETLAHGALACVAVFLALLARREEGVSRAAFTGRLAAAAVLTGCLAAPVLLPVLEVLPESERWAMVERVPRSVDPPPFEARFLLLPLQPLLFGSPRDGTWDGPANFNEMCSGYGGVLALVLAVAGAALPGGRRRLLLLLLLAGGLAAFLASLGISPFFDLVDAIPGMSHGAHARLRLLWVLAVAVAAGLGLEDLLRDRRGPWIAGALLAAAALALILHPSAVFWERAWWIAVLAGAAAVVAALAVPRLRHAVPALAVLALGLDLALLLVRYHPAVPGTFDLAAPAALARLADEARQAPEPFRVMAEGRDLEPDLGALYGLWDPRGYDPMRPAAAALVTGRGFLPRFKVGREIRVESRRFPVHAQPMFDYLGVRYLLTRHQRRVPPPWEPAWNDTGGRVWRNTRALPLFFLPASARREPAEEKALELALGNRDFAASGVAEGAPAAGPRPQSGTARIALVLPNGFDLEVETVTGGLVVSSVAFADGWSLDLVDGPGPAELRRVNGGFTGFEIGPGRHRVRLDYRPAGWRWGLGAAGTALLVALGWALARRRPMNPAAPRSAAARSPAR